MTQTLDSPLIVLRGVWRSFRGVEEIHALRDVTLTIHRSEFLAVVGPSGSGKSTLLNLISGLDRASHGRIKAAGFALDALSEAELTAWRRSHVGMVFQAHNLIPVLTAVENVELPLLLRPLSAAERRGRALHALRLVDLEERAGAFPDELSGGQQQRVAIARAIVADPPIVVADEPTGNLDAQAADRVLEILAYLARERAKTVVMVTHDARAQALADRSVRIDKGRLEETDGARLSLVPKGMPCA